MALGPVLHPIAFWPGIFGRGPRGQRIADLVFLDRLGFEFGGAPPGMPAVGHGSIAIFDQREAAENQAAGLRFSVEIFRTRDHHAVLITGDVRVLDAE